VLEELDQFKKGQLIPEFAEGPESLFRITWISCLEDHMISLTGPPWNGKLKGISKSWLNPDNQFNANEMFGEEKKRSPKNLETQLYISSNLRKIERVILRSKDINLRTESKVFGYSCWRLLRLKKSKIGELENTGKYVMDLIDITSINKLRPWSRFPVEAKAVLGSVKGVKGNALTFSLGQKLRIFGVCINTNFKGK